ncbi:N-acetyl-ornithine/N-acetyl-lysine deacetylase [mine drainage metagenome]|uniref:N-acetyl-ornithine/N-acetyl-lysine deacetylase n=1 Tax=mine drainage metagenome TaxID=410659 RepID=T1ADX5_9ZZZZ
MKVIGLETRGDGDRESVRVRIDLRLPPGSRSAEILRALPRDPGRPRFSVSVRIEPIEAARDGPVVRALEAGIRAAGGRPTRWRKSGTSDWNLVGSVWRTAGAAYGPGDPHLDHTASESVPVRDLARSVRVLRTAFDQLAHPPPAPDASPRPVTDRPT